MSNIVIVDAVRTPIGKPNRAIASRKGIDVDVALERAHIGYVKSAILMVIVISMFASQADAILTNKAAVARLVPPMIAFFALAFALSITVGRSTSMPHPHIVALASPRHHATPKRHSRSPSPRSPAHS